MVVKYFHGDESNGFSSVKVKSTKKQQIQQDPLNGPLNLSI